MNGVGHSTQCCISCRSTRRSLHVERYIAAMAGRLRAPVFRVTTVAMFLVLSANAGCAREAGPTTPADTFDAGPLLAVDGNTFVHRFCVVNSTGRDVRILKEKHSCDCVSAELDKNDLRAGESTFLKVRAKLSPAYPKKNVACILETDAPLFPEWIYRLVYESYPEARIVPDRIDAGTISFSGPARPSGGPDLAAKKVWLEVFRQPETLARARAQVQLTSEECSVSVGELAEVRDLPSGHRVERYPLSIAVKNSALRAGSFLRPVRITVDDRSTAAATIVWTVRAAVSAEPSQIHFGAVALNDSSPPRRTLIVRSSDRRPFRILQVLPGELVCVDQGSTSSQSSASAAVHQLAFVLRTRDSVPQFMAGSIRIKLDAADCPEITVPWSAFARQQIAEAQPRAHATN